MRWPPTRPEVLGPILAGMPWPSILAAFLTPIISIIVTRVARALGQRDPGTTRSGRLVTQATTWLIAWMLVQAVLEKVAPHLRRRVVSRVRSRFHRAR